MPRLVFDNPKEFKKWISGFVRSPGRYVAYYTSNDEIVLKPTINPRDNDYAYIKVHTAQEEKELRDYISERHIEIFQVKDYEWRLDQSIGVRTVLPEE